MSTGVPHPRIHPIRPTSVASTRETRLVLAALDRSVDLYFSSGLASSTSKVYSAALNHYFKFCNHYSLSTLPASEQLLCRFVTYLALDHVSVNSLRVYLSAVRQLHLQHHLTPPIIAAMPHLQQVLRGIKISQAKSPNSAAIPRSRLPITPALLRDIHRS